MSIPILEKDKKTFTLKFKRIVEVANHSKSDYDFFCKIRMLTSIKPTQETTIAQDIRKQLILNDYNNDQLPPLLETTLRQLKEDD